MVALAALAALAAPSRGPDRREVLTEEGPDELPSFLRGLDPIVGTIDREERVTGVVEGVELERLVVRAQLLLDARDLLG
jgi:hypothetical protein